MFCFTRKRIGVRTLSAINKSPSQLVSQGTDDSHFCVFLIIVARIRVMRAAVCLFVMILDTQQKRRSGGVKIADRDAREHNET